MSDWHFLRGVMEKPVVVGDVVLLWALYVLSRFGIYFLMSLLRRTVK